MKNFIWLPFNPLWLFYPIIQLVSEPVRSLSVRNMLCDPNATWRNVHKACDFQLRGFWLLEKPNSQLSFDPSSCHLRDHIRGIHDSGYARQRDTR
jgi:hypothetical protein